MQNKIQKFLSKPSSFFLLRLNQKTIQSRSKNSLWRLFWKKLFCTCHFKWSFKRFFFILWNYKTLWMDLFFLCQFQKEIRKQNIRCFVLFFVCSCVENLSRIYMIVSFAEKHFIILFNYWKILISAESSFNLQPDVGYENNFVRNIPKWNTGT